MGPSQSVTVRHLPGPVPAERAREGEMGKSDGENDSMFAATNRIWKKGTNKNTFCRKSRDQTYLECPENNDKTKMSEETSQASELLIQIALFFFFKPWNTTPLPHSARAEDPRRVSRWRSPRRRCDAHHGEVKLIRVYSSSTRVT